MDKFEIANNLREAGLLLTIAGENRYKARAYLNGARSVESLSEDIDRVIEQKKLQSIPGIGKALAANIEEIYTTGELRMIKQLKEELPPGVVELSQVPGLTLKRIQALTDALKVQTVDELEAACRENRVQLVSGFGEKLELSILRSIEAYRKHARKMLLLQARSTASSLVDYLRSALRSKKVDVAGEIRRWHEVVETIELVADDCNAIDALEKYPLVTRVTEKSETQCEVRLAEGELVQLTVSPCFATALLVQTGAPEHVDRLRKIALEKGYKLAVDGLYNKERRIEIRSEAQVYEALGLQYVPPEQREDLDEFKLASNYKEDGGFGDLLQIDHIQGMTHCHTTYSDGIHSVKEMALAAQNLGMHYLTITDHSPAAHYANGLEIDRLKKQWEEIDKVQQEVKIKLLKGTESDILADGQLDYPDHVLEQFDVIIASIHARFKLDFAGMTKRLLRCMRDRHFKIWGHPLGRLLLRREPIDCDVEKILDVIAESNAAVEVNGDPYRLDMEPRWLREARKRGIKFVVSTDAHSTRDYRSLLFGVHQARRAGITKSEVLNTQSVEEFCAAVRPTM